MHVIVLYGPLEGLLTAVTIAFMNTMIVVDSSKQRFHDCLVNFESVLEAEMLTCLLSFR